MLGEPLLHFPELDSTNTDLKRRAALGAPEGLTVLADSQTHGKGRLGRTFQSLPGKGLYLSVLLRPQVPLEVAGRFTAWAAVAVCRALEKELGLAADIKWPNDILVHGKKLCGILTEASGSAVILGLGLNLTQTPADFGPDLAAIATSLSQLGFAPDPTRLTHAILSELDELYRRFPADSAACLADFRSRCVTLGKDVLLVRPTGSTPAKALDVTDTFALLVDISGRRETVSSGEVSVRGLLGYTP